MLAGKLPIHRCRKWPCVPFGFPSEDLKRPSMFVRGLARYAVIECLGRLGTRPVCRVTAERGY